MVVSLIRWQGKILDRPGKPLCTFSYLLKGLGNLPFQSRCALWNWRRLIIGSPGILWGTLQAVVGYSIPVRMQWELCSHPHYLVERFLGGCWTLSLSWTVALSLWSCSWFSWTGFRGVARTRSVSGCGASAFSQMIWFSWPLRLTAHPGEVRSWVWCGWDEDQHLEVWGHGSLLENNGFFVLGSCGGLSDEWLGSPKEMGWGAQTSRERLE